MYRNLVIITSAVLYVHAAEGYTSQAEYVDLRDHVTYSTQFADISSLILKEMKLNPCLFLADLDTKMSPSEVKACASNVQLSSNGAQGPDGIDHGTYFEEITSNRGTRENTIFSVEFDGPNSILKEKSGFTTVKVILFVNDQSQHRSSNGYFFRRMTLEIDRSKKLSVLTTQAIIPLADTHFSFFTDVLERKTVIVDERNSIIKVFPIAVGAFDIRTRPGMSGFVGSTTEELVNNAMIYVGQPGGLHLVRADVSRYRHRPFLGVVDDDGTNYKQIGWHYKMAEGEFVRGFVTHGCMRIDDKDLYQMSAIVFSSGQSAVPVKIVNSFSNYSDLKRFAHLDHPMPKSNGEFLFVGYSDGKYLDSNILSRISNDVAKKPQSTRLSESERHNWCIQNNRVELGRDGLPLNLRQDGTWISALDEYCLTKLLSSSSVRAQSILDYISGISKAIPLAPTLPYVAPKIMTGLCEGNLFDAQKVYRARTSNASNPKDNVLTYLTYVGNCGCSRFKVALDQTLLKGKDGNLMSQSDKNRYYQKYCEMDPSGR